MTLNIDNLPNWITPDGGRTLSKTEALKVTAQVLAAHQITFGQSEATDDLAYQCLVDLLGGDGWAEVANALLDALEQEGCR